MLIEHLLCARYCSKCLRRGDEWVLEVYIVVEGDNKQTNKTQKEISVSDKGYTESQKTLNASKSKVGLIWVR